MSDEEQADASGEAAAPFQGTIGDGSRPPLPAAPAPQRPSRRRPATGSRAPFLPDHDHARHALKPHGH